MREAAHLIGISVSTYRDWEYGRKIPASYISHMAKAFDVSIHRLLGEDHPNKEVDLKEVLFHLEQAIKLLKELPST